MSQRTGNRRFFAAAAGVAIAMVGIVFAGCTSGGGGGAAMPVVGGGRARPNSVMVVTSNVDNTELSLMPYGAREWQQTKTGKTAQFDVNRGTRYKLRAKAEGYEERTYDMTEGYPEFSVILTRNIPRGGGGSVVDPAVIQKWAEQQVEIERQKLALKQREDELERQAAEAKTAAEAERIGRREAELKKLQEEVERKKQELALREQDSAPRPPPPPGRIRERWAVVIGVSNYEDSRIPDLRYAAKDAKAVYQWLVSKNGGGYDPKRVRLLVDEQVTYESMRDSFFVWLRNALAEDLVVIYFSGHGTPESPARPDNLYLVPHDGKYDKIGTSCFPMWDIQTALKRHIAARRVVVVADACHAGGVGAEFGVGGFRAIGTEGVINEKLHELAYVGEGIAVLTSSRADQLSREDAKFGGGHGVFTHYFLEGVKGAADSDKDKRVGLSELVTYVSVNVRERTANAQAPEVAGKFDPTLSLKAEK